MDDNYPAGADLDNYVVISETINDDDEEAGRVEIPYCGGTLIGYIESNYTITLLDFRGDTRILFIPSSITINGNRYNVNPEIPDMAFESCTNVEYLVVDFFQNLSFGSCVFYNCSRLSDILQISFGEGNSFYGELVDPKIQMDEYSFCAIDIPNVRIVYMGDPESYFCGAWIEHSNAFQLEVESYPEDKQIEEYKHFREVELQAIRDFRWMAELSGRIEQLIVHYSTTDDKTAFLRLLRCADFNFPLSYLFTWAGLEHCGIGYGTRKYFADIDDEMLYADLCRMKPLKSEQYRGYWEMCF